MYAGTRSTKYRLTDVKTPPGSLYGFDPFPDWLPLAAGAAAAYYFFFRKKK